MEEIRPVRRTAVFGRMRATLGTETAVVRVPAAPGEAADEGGCRPSAGTAFEGCRNRASPIDYWVGAPESGSALVGLSMSLSVRPGTHPRTLADKG